MGGWDLTTTLSSGNPDHYYECFQELVQRHRLPQRQCMLNLVTTFFGYFLIGTVTISQIPQILKILRRRNASGVSFVSIILMLQASSSKVAYCVQQNFPFSAWGENLVLMVEMVVLVLLLLSYNKRPISAVCFMVFYTLIMLALIIPLVPTKFITYLNICSIPVLSISRIIQIYTNHKNHDTGQLSGTSSFLCVFQSFGRISTSILLTRDWILILTFVQLLISNLILTLQVIYYRRKNRNLLNNI